MKRFTKGSSAKMSMEYKRGVPADINRAFKARKVDAAFISSIVGKKYKHVKLGIIARQDVRSVLVIPNTKSKSDRESATSNVLAKVLGMQGEVLIGDKALRYALQTDKYIDLARVWHEKYRYPFVFALLCYHKDEKLYKTIEREFLKHKIKIPQYILKHASKKTAVQESDIVEYLKLISYELDNKAKLGLAKFYKEATKVI